MGYAFEAGETASDALRRITREQVGRAVSALEEADDRDVETAVHDCRKGAKKLRGLLRLVRPALGGAYRPANEKFRDAGRELSTVRDAHAALATFDDLVAASPDRLPDGGLRPVRSGLAALAEEATHAGDRLVRAERAAELFRSGGDHVDRAELDAEGWAAIGPGLERTYRAGRHGLAGVRSDRGADPTLVHEWRKRTKDAWYHVRLLSDAAPSILEPLDDRLHDLSDALGDAHDLVVICGRLRGSPERFGGPHLVDAACGLAGARRADLEQRAAQLGARLFAEKPKAYAARMGAYWRVWQEEGTEEPAGGLADLFPPDDDLDDLDLEQLRDRAGEAALPGRLYPARSDLIGDLRAIGAT
jgi:CHAD domain-containing protein